MADDNNMLAAAKAEVRWLESELAKSPLFQKLQLARQVVDLYSKSAVSQQAVQRAVQPIVEAHRTKTARIEAAVADHLAKTHRRATSGELTEALNAMGISLPGKVPAKSLSAYLSNSDRFDNDREQGGYGLVEWSSATAPNGHAGGDSPS